MKLLLGATPTALWYEIVHEAESICSISLKDELESYLVSLLTRYSARPDVVKKIIATDFLNGTKKEGYAKQAILQEVGDNCLILSGLFPKIAAKRLVKLSYFVNIGRAAYLGISYAKNDLYNALSTHFVPLMDVLQSIRQHAKEIPDLLPLEAYDLWNETGSQRALSVLKQYTSATPLGAKS